MKKIVVVDVDGTISKIGDRINCITGEEKDWHNFYMRCGEDEPVKPIIDLVFSLSCDYEIVFCTGRKEKARKITEMWISYYLTKELSKNIIMRENNDNREDTEIKPENLKNYFNSRLDINVNDIAFILEDRTSMVKKWRELGFTCLQVDNGDF